MSATPEGVGTKANISQDALTDNGLFLDKAESWSEFRKEKGHEMMVNDFLDKFLKYPKSVLKITNNPALREEKARYLKKLAKKKNREATEILKRIHEIDRLEKIEYLNYLKSGKQSPEMIKRFFVLIKLGVHRNDELGELMGDNNFFQRTDNLLIYYSNTRGGEILIEKEDVGKKIKEIVSKLNGFQIIFPRNTTHCKLVGIKNNSVIPLFQIVFHWKNIHQGIKTPCLNIFDLMVRKNVRPK